MPTEKINYSDPLRVGTDKLNKAIDDVNSFQKQIDVIVVKGDSSVEAAQARLNEWKLRWNKKAHQEYK